MKITKLDHDHHPSARTRAASFPRRATAAPAVSGSCGHWLWRLSSAGASAFTLAACAAGTTAQEPSTEVTFTDHVHLMPVQDGGARAASAAPPAQIAPAGAHLTYHGGKVVQDAHVTQVLYGSGTYIPELTSTSGVNMASAYTQMLTSGVFDWLSEYNTASPAQAIGRGLFGGAARITPAASRNGSTITDASIQGEIAAQISAGALPAPTNNQIYMVSFPAGKSLVAPDGSLSCAPRGFCAYHGTFKIGAQNVYYGVLPALTDGMCASQCGGGTTFQNQQSVASHELIETITDAEIGLTTVIAPPLAWYDFDPANNINAEIGDLCNAQQATFVGLDSNSYTIQQEFSNQHNDCIAMPPPAIQQHVIFGSADSHVHELFNDGTHWTGNNDLTAFLGGATTVTNVAGYSLGITQHIVFRSADSHLHEYYNDGANWFDNDLTASIGGAGPAGAPSGYTLGITQHIVFRSADSHVHELFNNGSFWVNNDLTAFLSGAPAAGDPSGFSLGNTQHIVFRGADNHLHDLFNNGSFWVDNDLSSSTGGAGPVGDPSGYGVGITQHIVFRSADSHVHEFFNNGSFWVNNDLTAFLGGASAASAPTGYSLADTQHIVFRSADNHLHEYYNNGANWFDNDLTAFAGGAGPSNLASGYILGNTQHIVFMGVDGHVHELFNNGATWVNNDLTTFLGGASPANRVAGYVR